MDTLLCHKCSKILPPKDFRVLNGKYKSKRCKACTLRASYPSHSLPLQEIPWYDDISDIIDEKVQSDRKLFWIYSDSVNKKIQEDLSLLPGTESRYEFFHFEGEKTILKSKIKDLFRYSRDPKKTIITLNVTSPRPTVLFFKLLNYLINELEVKYVLVFTEAYLPPYEKYIQDVNTSVYKNVKDIIAIEWMSSVKSGESIDSF